MPYLTASFFGGTSLLIIVGVILAPLRQIEPHLLPRPSDGVRRNGRIRGTGYSRTTAVREGEPANQSTMVMLCVGAALLFICGLAIFLNR